MIAWVVWRWVPGRKIPRKRGWKMETHGSRELIQERVGIVRADDHTTALFLARRQHGHDVRVQSQVSFDLTEQDARYLHLTR